MSESLTRNYYEFIVEISNEGSRCIVAKPVNLLLKFLMKVAVVLLLSL